MLDSSSEMDQKLGALNAKNGELLPGNKEQFEEMNKSQE